MTTQEVLNKIADNDGCGEWLGMLSYYDDTPKFLTLFIEKAMQVYAAQFINCANEIITPALDILPETYKDELDAWCNLQNINKI